MRRWLVKSEPDTFSFDDLVRDGRVTWDGVRNHTAARNLKEMAVGDEVLFYHSQESLAVVGIAKVTRTAFPDVTDPTGKFVAVELGPVRPVPKPVTLAQMKAEPALAEMPTVRQGRLSVAPVSDAEWKVILNMAGA